MGSQYIQLAPVNPIPYLVRDNSQLNCLAQPKQIQAIVFYPFSLHILVGLVYINTYWKKNFFDQAEATKSKIEISFGASGM